MESEFESLKIESAPTPKTFSAYKVINGHDTNLCLSIFTNQIFIIVSQIDTFGTVVQARKRESLSENFQSEVQVLLGRRDDPLLLVYARQFLERIGSPLGLPVVAAIGLKDRSSNAFEQVVNQLQDLMTCYKNA
ncbi:hypothetical protein ABG067_004246 [Albugo candida]|uniref:Uncharacterized protein n=1 Tax=Albugo candida TaxID=65357 RepID=A0A024G631_9STRA|nr:unnamed protein product [Albugo candida]|eukprot:CCI42217.1 unnamed protein product [Albugo candida]